METTLAIKTKYKSIARPFLGWSARLRRQPSVTTLQSDWSIFD
jgi:hypothetical protein